MYTFLTISHAKKLQLLTGIDCP